MEKAMKTIISKQTDNSRPENEKNERICDGIEKILRNIFIIVFVIFIAVQAALTNDRMRELLVREALDGKPIGDEVFLFEKCKMELSLKGMPNCPELRVLVNGDEAGAFHDGTVLLELKEGDVVELDANRLLVNAEVQISAVSRNLAHLLGRTVTADNGIVRVAVADADEQAF